MCCESFSETGRQTESGSPRHTSHHPPNIIAEDGAPTSLSFIHQEARQGGHPAPQEKSMSKFLRRFILVLLAIGVCPAPLLSQVIGQPKPIRIKVVVVTMFERGEDTGDTPGEYQLWVEREHLDQIIPLPSGYHHVRLNKDGVLGILTGVGTAKAAASVMAVGLDPRFDLSKAYWIVAGIGGGDPEDVSLGSAVWADHVIDGD